MSVHLSNVGLGTKADANCFCFHCRCWGICNSAGTGKVMSEILFDGMAISADVGDLAPI